MSGKATVPGRGRKPKPAAVKVATGNPGKRKLVKDTLTPITGVDPPPHLSAIASTMWSSVAPTLCAQRVLCGTDLHNLEGFCTAYANYRAAQQSIDTVGILIFEDGGRMSKNPACTVVNEALKQMTMLGSLLGLDPASRQRVMTGGQEEQKDPWAEL
ncbi:phage terminase small subunit P27 family [Crenobacter cavernae]|uniref:Phage terminase small subunit P27 family n=1 Tax=Crenobacter cavernae TaxID=2290923 RepID=A0ABY0FAM1_9NEIS|nr:phage terminase small subunit P27 family [Crenobacter cavernae]RXZ42694.1 phage terminase small subunit P27 family [Crenobacter cavernae]